MRDYEYVNIKIAYIKPLVEDVSLLYMVKFIKEISGLGLKEAKDLCDKLRSNSNKFYPISIEQPLLHKLKYECKNYNLTTSYNTEFLRNINILKVGVGTETDFIEAILEVSKMYNNSDEILATVLSKLNKDQLSKILNEIKL